MFLGLVWKLKLRIPSDAKSALEEFDKAYREEGYLHPNGAVPMRSFPMADILPQGLSAEQVREHIVQGTEVGKAIVRGRAAFRMCRK